MAGERYSCGLVTGPASEYNEEYIPHIEIPCSSAGGGLQLLVHQIGNADFLD